MRVALFLLMALAASAVSAQNRLTIVVDGIENPSGYLVVGLYDRENFMKKPIGGQIVKVESETVTVTLENVPSGEYAVSLFHDENGNKKLDKGLFGIPTEKYGVSNNAKGKFGPPSYDDCKFVIKSDMKIAITL
jgi:uncharacterized protein (DUF2141 family)